MVKISQRYKGILMGQVNLIFPATQFPSLNEITATRLLGIFPDKYYGFHTGLIFKTTNDFILHTYLPFASIFQFYLGDILLLLLIYTEQHHYF